MTDSQSEVGNRNYQDGFEYIQDYLATLEVFKTGIDQFDDLFANEPHLGAFCGEIIEIVGLPASGKTMLLKTIMINILEGFEERDIIYIDSKFDFQAIKVKNMMESRGISLKNQAKMLKRILVHRASTPEVLLSILQFIVDTPKQHELYKIIMIDSITVPFYFYLGNNQIKLGAMTKVVQLLKKLAMMKITILITNLGYSSIETRSSLLVSQPSNQEDNEELETIITVKPALGAYWGNVAHHKVLIDFIDYPHDINTDLELVERKISLLISKNFKPKIGQHLRITESGVS